MEAQIDVARDDLHAFGHGCPALEAPPAIVDKIHALLVARADALMGCTRGSPEEAELSAIARRL